MQPFRRGAALLASFSLFALAGCHHGDTDDTGHTVLNGTSAVATVNGQDITQQQFFTQLQNYIPTPQNPQVPTTSQAAGPAVLRQLISALLVEEYAKDQGVAPTDAEVDSLYSAFKTAQETRSVKPYDQLLSEAGLTPDDIKNTTLKFQLAQIKLLTKGQPPVSDANISAYYALNKDKLFTQPDRAHIKRLVLSNPTDAQRIAGQLQKGQSFDSFTSQSLDRQFPGGDVPVWVNLDAPGLSQFVPSPLIAQIKKAKPGDANASVVGPYAFHGVYYIVQVIEIRPKETVPLDQVKDSIRFEIMRQNASKDPSRLQAVTQELRDYQAKAKITIPDKRYAQLQTELTTPPPPQPAAPQLNLSAPPAKAPKG